MAAFPRDGRDALVAAIAALDDLKIIGVTRDIEIILGSLISGREQMTTQVAEAGWQSSSAVRHLQWAPIGRMRLESSLLGVTDEMLDKHPLAGEWSVRQQLAHVELTYERYTIACQYTASRADDEPFRTPASLYPERVGSPEGNPGEPLWEIIARHREVWDRAIEPLCAIPDDKLQRSTEWHSAEHTLAFRLHRFGAHDLEIATDLRATVAALGLRQTESHYWARALLEEWGELESALLGVPERVADASGLTEALAGWREADLTAAAAYGKRADTQP